MRVLLLALGWLGAGSWWFGRGSGPEPVDPDPPAGGPPAAAGGDPFEEAVPDEPTLGPLDRGGGVLGEGGDLGLAHPVAELAVVAGEPSHAAQHGPAGPYGD